jgi:hypothetical protein
VNTLRPETHRAVAGVELRKQSKAAGMGWAFAHQFQISRRALGSSCCAS